MNKIFENNIITAFKDAGQKWLTDLPQTLQNAIEYWNLKNFEEVNNLSFNYVGTVQYNYKSVILKICCDKKDFEQEITALKTYNGKSCVKLIDSNSELQAMLIDRATPGISLEYTYPNEDDKAIEIAANIMRELHLVKFESNINLPTLKIWIKDLFDPQTKFESEHLVKAQQLAKELLDTTAKSVLLHGDLHHTNILLNNNKWVAIDPKGIIGDPAFDVVAFIRNPHPEILKPKEIIKSRVKLFSELLQIDQKRIYDWLYVNAVLNACWSINDGETDINKIFAEANAIESIMDEPSLI